MNTSSGLDTLSPADKQHLHDLWQEKIRRDQRARIETTLKDFTQEAWAVLEPQRKLQWNWHLDSICEHLEAFRLRDIQNLIINVPFRSMKSLLVEVFYPSWVWTTDAWHQFLCLSHNDSLALRDAGKHRQLIESPWYQHYWGDRYRLVSDAKEYFWTDQNGHRVSQGMSGGLTGKGGDTILIDDPHDAERAQSDVELDNAIERYDSKVTSRLNDPGSSGICLIMQRLNKRDLTGHLLTKTDQEWVHLVVPMRYEGRKTLSNAPGMKHNKDPRRKVGDLMWPDRFPPAAVRRLEEDLGTYGTSGQLQQRPSPMGGGILKRDWWRRWPKDKPFPLCVHIFQSWDTAYSEKDIETNSRSARTTWGVFFDDAADRYGILMLDAWADWVGYPDLRRLAKAAYREWKPDAVLIEKKASGHSLIQDMRHAHIPVTTYQPDRDKVSRAHAIAPIMESGLVWAPERKWAEDVIEECADFPRGTHNDYVDTVTQAMIYAKSRWLLRIPDDDEHSEQQQLTEEEIEDMKQVKDVPIYG